jgi:hypothetical protein
MRIWSLHPKYLDAKGLVALWRETLLGRAVLAGQTKGYTNHPQLLRFRGQPDPIAAVDGYLWSVYDEAGVRGYRFEGSKIRGGRIEGARLPVTEGQLRYELRHLHAKLLVRCPEWCARIQSIDLPEPHPLFHVVPGEVEAWERVVKLGAAAQR